MKANVTEEKLKEAALEQAMKDEKAAEVKMIDIPMPEELTKAIKRISIYLGINNVTDTITYLVNKELGVITVTERNAVAILIKSMIDEGILLKDDLTEEQKTQLKEMNVIMTEEDVKKKAQKDLPKKESAPSGEDPKMEVVE